MVRAFYLISYDIPDDKRRGKIAHLLEGYGERVQYSVFEVWATDKELEKLAGQLRRLVQARTGEKPACKSAEDEETPPEPENGSVRIYVLCSTCKDKRVVLGDGQPTDAPGLWII